MNTYNIILEIDTEGNEVGTRITFGKKLLESEMLFIANKSPKVISKFIVDKVKEEFINNDENQDETNADADNEQQETEDAPEGAENVESETMQDVQVV